MSTDLKRAEDLISKKLPRFSRWWIREIPWDWDFDVEKYGFMKGDQIDIHGISDPAWSDLRVFGRIDYAEGGGASPFLTIRESDGTVCSLDVELDEPVADFNTSLDDFIDTYFCLNPHFSIQQDALPLNELKSQVQEIDSNLHFSHPRRIGPCNWRVLNRFKRKRVKFSRDRLLQGRFKPEPRVHPEMGKR